MKNGVRGDDEDDNDDYDDDGDQNDKNEYDDNDEFNQRFTPFLRNHFICIRSTVGIYFDSYHNRMIL